MNPFLFLSKYFTLRSSKNQILGIKIVHNQSGSIPPLALYGLGFLALLGAGLALLANGPDREIEFTRNVPSMSEAGVLDQAIRNTINWPDWTFSTLAARVVDGNGKPFPDAEQKIETGSQVRIWIDPGKGPWQKFELLIKVLEYVPATRIRMALLEDTKNRLPTLFDGLEWSIELERSSDPRFKTLVKGRATARTKHWRSRLFGSIAPTILMHQAYYPDLIKLAKITEPKPVIPAAPAQR